MAGFNEKVCLSPEGNQDLQARLKRAEGQLRGIQKMLDERRSCQDLIIQLVAVKEAVSQIAVTVLSQQLVHCLTVEIAEGKSTEDVAARFMEVFKKLS